MKKWGKDKQFFYNTKHCPNCDGRILMKDQNKDALRKRIEQLRQYANQCGITGDLEEKRAALKEIANLEAEFKSLTENLPIKDTLNPTTAESIKNMPDEQIRHHIIEEVNKEGNGAPVLEDGSLTDKVIAFFKSHPNPPDAAVHAFAQQLNIAPDIIETEIYKLVTKYVQTTKDMEVKTVSKDKRIAARDKRIAARDAALKALDELKKTKDEMYLGEYKGYKMYQEGADRFYYMGSRGDKIQYSDLSGLKDRIDQEVNRAHMQHHGMDKKTKDTYYYHGEDWNQNELWNQLVKEGNTKRFSELTSEEKKIKNDRFAIYCSSTGGVYAVVRDSAKDKALKALDSLKRAVGMNDADLPVGKHNDVSDDQFDANELAMGIKIESEHTDDLDIAKAIAKDHLMEDKSYYTHLKEMENKYKTKDAETIIFSQNGYKIFQQEDGLYEATTPIGWRARNIKDATEARKWITEQMRKDGAIK
jgi:hypothetical protein